MSPIDEYLAELGRLLPRRGRRRILAEVEAHLREAAEDRGETAAVACFGGAADVAAGFRACAADGSRRLLSVAATLAAGQVVLWLAPIVPHHWQQSPVAPYARLLPAAVFLDVTGARRWLAFATACGLASAAVAAVRHPRMRRAAAAVLGVLVTTLGAYVAAGWYSVGHFPFARESEVLLALAPAAPLVLHVATRRRRLPRFVLPLAAGVGLVGLIGLALPDVLLRLVDVDLSYADTSAYGTAVRIAQQAWLVAAAATLVWSIRAASRREPA